MTSLELNISLTLLYVRGFGGRDCMTEMGEVALKIVESRVPEGLSNENRNRKEGNYSPKISEVDPK